MDDLPSQNSFLRVDLLTGCANLVSFSKELRDNFQKKTLDPVSFIVVDLYQLRGINQAKGFDYGDTLLRWMGIAIKDVTEAAVYRISGNNFVAVLIGGTHEEHEGKARTLFDRLNNEARQLELKIPAVRMAVIQFPENEVLNSAIVWRNLNEKLELTRVENPFEVFQADISGEDQATLRAIELMAKRIETLGGTLQYTFKLAYTDPVSNAPNMLAIQRKLDLSITESMLNDQYLSLCLLDGDSLKKYNTRGYQAGDDVIRKITQTLSTALRPTDFLGRWRMGDEFIVILPSTNVDQACLVAERLRESIERASQEWLFPTSISIGVSYHPKHGYTSSQLIAEAEKALSIAKATGKNKVIIAP